MCFFPLCSRIFLGEKMSCSRRQRQFRRQKSFSQQRNNTAKVFEQERPWNTLCVLLETLFFRLVEKQMLYLAFPHLWNSIPPEEEGEKKPPCFRLLLLPVFDVSCCNLIFAVRPTPFFPTFYGGKLHVRKKEEEKGVLLWGKGRGGWESTIITLQQAEETQNPVLTAISPIYLTRPTPIIGAYYSKKKVHLEIPNAKEYKKITAMCVGISEQTKNSGIIFPAAQYSCCSSSKGVDWS